MIRNTDDLIVLHKAFEDASDVQHYEALKYVRMSCYQYPN